MDTLVLDDPKITNLPVGRVVWFGNSDLLFGVDEIGQVFRFESLAKVTREPVRLRRLLADWFGGGAR